MRVIILLVLVMLSIGVNLCLGEIQLEPQALLQAFTHPVEWSNDNPGLAGLLWQIRLPRTVAGALVGSALALSGYLLQTLANNYLADPYLTGVSSGAALAVACALILNTPFHILPFAALAGGLAASLTVALMARTASGLSMTRLLLSGVALSAVCGSIMTLIMINLQGAGRVRGLYYWLSGSISGSDWVRIQPLFPYIAAGALAALLLSKPLRMLALGPASASSLGLNVPLAQWAILITAVVLCGSAVALSGLVGFVGLIAPYIARHLLGTDERLHLAGAASIGAILVLISDLAARTLIPDMELPLGTLLSLVGAPFFLWLILRHKDEAL